ncbi:uncharacterized protein A4U43_C07F29510 [Asparagus officinalis]|uniref:FMN-dependent dehydrogenase domain-containing protein n=1 Tax=Asparagus officinalis TaxID=4686 RepID=A0A5P1EG66_ASPOF|nr:uncharacterized protein A4U43_C07F29510 [Asparagus officinalis]
MASMSSMAPIPSSSSSSSMSTDISISSNPNSSSIKTVRVVVKGRVLGVFFRDWTMENTHELGLNVGCTVDGNDPKDLQMEINKGVVEIGRPVVFSLAAEGEAGVRKVLQMLRDEFELTMALSGCTSLKEITRNHIVTPAEQNRITPRMLVVKDSCSMQGHCVLLDIVSSAANATPRLGRYPPFKREVVTIASAALESFKNEAKKMVVALVYMERAFVPPQYFIRLVQRRLARLAQWPIQFY